MTYTVKYMPSVITAINRQVDHLQNQMVSSDRIAAWLSQLFDLADSLEQLPLRHAIDHSISNAVNAQIRRVHFGNYFLFYHVDESSRRVDFVHFRHVAQETNMPPLNQLRPWEI